MLLRSATLFRLRRIRLRHTGSPVSTGALSKALERGRPESLALRKPKQPSRAISASTVVQETQRLQLRLCPASTGDRRDLSAEARCWRRRTPVLPFTIYHSLFTVFRWRCGDSAPSAPTAPRVGHSLMTLFLIASSYFALFKSQ